MSTPAAVCDERGSGVVSTTFGVGVFLLLLTFAAHVLLNLWLVSAVDAVAHDLATDVATSGAPDDRLAGVAALATTRARRALGGYGDRVELEFVDLAADRVVLHVRAPQLRLLPAPLAALLGDDPLDRRITVRREPPDP